MQETRRMHQAANIGPERASRISPFSVDDAGKGSPRSLPDRPTFHKSDSSIERATTTRRSNAQSIASLSSSKSSSTISSKETGNNTSTTTYWTVSSGVANRTGHSCRECRKIIAVGEQIFVRDGRKTRLFYHSACFSNDSDPRTQAAAVNRAVEKFGGVIQSNAPPVKGRGKWSVASYGYQPR